MARDRDLRAPGGVRPARASARARRTVGVALLCLAGAGVAYPLWWNHRSQSGGAALLAGPSGTRSERTGTGTGARPEVGLESRSCTSGLAGVLAVPTLSLRAPVLQGLGDAVLNVAVGHDPASPWPGAPGESILEAHDVSWFSGLDSLRPGQTIDWLAGCRRLSFRVLSTEVSWPGAVVLPPPGGTGLALVTCWPTNALFWTPQRFVVTASLTASQATSGPGTVPKVSRSRITVALPAGLEYLDQVNPANEVLLAGLQLAGRPERSWAQSPLPLEVEKTVLVAYLAAEAATSAHSVSWWRALAEPGTALVAPWSTAYRSTVTIVADGSAVVGAQVQSAAVAVRFVVRGDKLLVASVAPG